MPRRCERFSQRAGELTSRNERLTFIGGKPDGEGYYAGRSLYDGWHRFGCMRRRWRQLRGRRRSGYVTCAITPRDGRGSNFILKLDDRTLPSGYRPSTQAVSVQRATRGKALRFNFGASIHGVVGLDIADAVFEPGTERMRSLRKPRMALLLKELQKAPAVLRLSYLADVEDARLVARRMNALKSEIMQAWEELNCCYRLAIEPEVFWRLGAPPQQAAVRAPGSR